MTIMSGHIRRLLLLLLHLLRPNAHLLLMVLLLLAHRRSVSHLLIRATG